MFFFLNSQINVFNIYDTYIHRPSKFVTRTKCLSVGRMRGAGSHWRYMTQVRKRQQNEALRWSLKELTDGELRIFKGIAFQICGAARQNFMFMFNHQYALGFGPFFPLPYYSFPFSFISFSFLIPYLAFPSLPPPLLSVFKSN